MYKAPPLDRKKRKVGFPFPLFSFHTHTHAHIHCKNVARSSYKIRDYCGNYLATATIVTHLCEDHATFFTVIYFIHTSQLVKINHDHAYVYLITEMARTSLCASSEPYTRTLQIHKSGRIAQSSKENHRPSWMHQSRDWAGVSEPRTHSQPGDLQTNILLCCSQWCTYAPVG